VERVPKKGAALLVANHSSYLDPPLAGIAIPRKLHFLARNTLFGNVFSRWFFKKLNCVAVNRERMDLATFRHVISQLEKGEIVVMFPEGTRSESGDLQEGKIGTGMIIHHAKVPVVPCYIEGASKALPKGVFFPHPAKIRVIYGNPLDFAHVERKEDRKEVYGVITEKVMNAIAELKQELETR